MSDIVVISIGMVTPLGLSLEQTAASVVAGLASFEETTMLDKGRQPFVMASLPTDILPKLNGALVNDASLTQREGRMLRLASLALDDVSIPLNGNKPAISVGLPDKQTTRPLDAELWLSRLHKLYPDSFDLSASRGITTGRSAGLAAVHHGIQMLRKGQTKYVFAGGVDSYFDPFVLGQLDAEGRVNSELNMDAFVPGEGACFLLICTAETAIAGSHTIIGPLSGCAIGEEPGHMYSEEPYLGEGLSNTLETLFESSERLSAPIETVFSSMNGENFFAKEWGVAFIRHQDKTSHDFDIEHPADCFGDTGAACGPIMVGLALSGLNNETTKGPVLVYASSDHAERSACLLDVAK